MWLLCRVPSLSAKSLPSARNPTLGKDPFAVGGFAEWRLPSVTLGKEFAECKLAFAECIRHSAKPVNPVVEFLEKSVDVARTMDFFYKRDDAYTLPLSIKDTITSMYVNPCDL